MTIPDFRKWKLAIVESIFLDIVRANIYYVKADLEDEQEIYWVGYRTRYANPDNLDRGVAVNFFGKGEVLKVWGGRELDKIAVLTPDGWKVFDTNQYILKFKVKMKKDAVLTAMHILLQGKEAWQGQEEFRIVKEPHT